MQSVLLCKHECLQISTERVELLVHIVRRLGRIGVTADKLLDIAFDCRRQLKEQEKFSIIEEIFKVRRLEERYERGEVGKHPLEFHTKDVSVSSLTPYQMPQQSSMSWTERRTPRVTEMQTQSPNLS